MELVPGAMASGGDAVARDPEGKAVFVRGALPGERVRVTLVASHARYAAAVIDEVLEASPDRVTPPCLEVDHGCGACPWQHVAPARQRELKEQFIVEAIERAGVPCPEPNPTVELPLWDCRTTIRASVAKGRAGYNRAHSHDVVPVASCLVAHPLLEELLVETRYPGAREVLLRCGARTGERLAATTPSGLRLTLPSDVQTESFHEEAAGRRWRISARSFFQSRADGADALATVVGQAADELGPASTAVDLYSGVGVFAGVLAARGWSVTAVEGSHSAADDAVVNLAALGVASIQADVTKWSAPAVDLVVADPSRIGLGRSGVDVVVATGARRVILVSCDAACLGRDASLLHAEGYRPSSVTAVDLFPHTFRIEAVTVFDRR
jgi:23S rRNA (uracil1939-C5)-methyltransferase